MPDEHGTATYAQHEEERRWHIEDSDPQGLATGPQSPAVKWTGLAVLLLFLAATAIAWLSMTPM